MDEDQQIPANTASPVVLALVGPTCSGKTALSLALAQKLEAEIIACDSRTIYRYMDIGTAKPSPEEQAVVPHHLIDVASPDETYTVAQYKEAASVVLDRLFARGRLAIVCGGTGFYARALLEGLDIPTVAPHPELRVSLKEQADREGNQALHKRLTELDPVSAGRINPNDRFRLVRALEVCLVVGRPFSELARRVAPPYRTIWLGLTCANRANLHAAIRARLCEQLRQGLLGEVEALFKRYGPCQSLLNTVNYKELILYLRGEAAREEAEELCVRHNCQLARRQLIWFRSNPEIHWFEVDKLNEDELFNRVLESLRKTPGL